MPRVLTRILFCSLSVLVVISCSSVGRESASPAPPAPDRDLALLASWMTGSFGSGEQAASDSAFFDVRLRMVRIWPERSDGCWLYVEQALAVQEHRPYRQRVYRLHRVSADTLASDVHTLADESRFVGAWKSLVAFAGITPDSLDLREGCTIYLTREGAFAFYGGTRGSRCESTLQGASYATSEVEITSDAVVSWDRGFDASGAQVWGATRRGYVFRRLPPD